MLATTALRAALVLALVQVAASAQIVEQARGRFVLEQLWRQEAMCGQPHLLPGRTQFVLERCDGANEVRDANTGEFVRTLPAGSIWMVSPDWVSINAENEVILLSVGDWRRRRLRSHGTDASGERAVPRTIAPDGLSAVGSDLAHVIEWRLDPNAAGFGEQVAWDGDDPTSYGTVSAYAPDSSFLVRAVWREGRQRLILGPRLSGYDDLDAPLPEAPVLGLAVGPRSDAVAALDSRGTVSIFYLATTDVPRPIEIVPISSFETGVTVPAGPRFMQFAGDEPLLIGDNAGEISAWTTSGSLLWRRSVSALSSAPVLESHNVLLVIAGNRLVALDLASGKPIAVDGPATFETGAVSSDAFAVTVEQQPEGALHEVATPMIGWRIRYRE